MKSWIGTWRRNFNPSTRRLRNKCQTCFSARVPSFRISRARSVDGLENLDLSRIRPSPGALKRADLSQREKYIARVRPKENGCVRIAGNAQHNPIGVVTGPEPGRCVRRSKGARTQAGQAMDQQ